MLSSVSQMQMKCLTKTHALLHRYIFMQKLKNIYTNSHELACCSFSQMVGLQDKVKQKAGLILQETSACLDPPGL